MMEKELMNSYFVRYRSGTLAALEGRDKQQTLPHATWHFNFPSRGFRMAMRDSLRLKDNINLHTGLDLFVDLKATSMEDAVRLSSEYVAMLLNLVCFSTLACCDAAVLTSVMSIEDTGVFPVKWYARPSEDKVVMGSTRVIDEPNFGALFDSATKNAYPDPERVMRALALLRKGIRETNILDEFLCYWIGMETIACILKDKLRFKVRNPKKWDGIKDILATRFGFHDFASVKQAREGLFHGFRRLDNAFAKEIRSYLEPMRKALISGIGYILGLEESITMASVDRSPLRVTSEIWTALEGNLKGLSSHFSELLKDYPSIDVQEKDVQFSLDKRGDLTATLSPSYTFHFPSGGSFEAKTIEVRR